MQPENSKEFSDSDRPLIDETLRFVAERAWRLSSSEFFRDLVTFLGNSLGVAYAFCDKIDPSDDTKVETLALYAHGEISENISYGLAGTPCENVVGREICCYVDKVQRQFPNDQMLVDLNVESYAGIPLWAADGSPLGLIAVMDDRPLRRLEVVRTVLQIVAVRAGAELERKQVLDRLQSSEQLLHGVINAVPAMISAKDRHSRYRIMNRYQADLYGTTPDDAVGRDAAELVGASYGEYTAALDESVFNTGQALVNFEEVWTDLEGNKRSLLTTKAPLRNSAGDVVNVVTVSIDITDRKQAEKAREAALADAERANRAKSEFLATMSHEFRTPLNAILGFSSIMRTQLFGPLGSEKYSEHAAYIHDSGEHLLAIINEILDISAIETGKRVLVKEPVDVDAVLNHCVKNIEKAFSDHAIELLVEVPEDIPPLSADKRSIIQIVLNLLSNAIKFSGENDRIVVSALATDKELTIKVVDSGIGIAPENLPRVTESFFQACTDPHLAHQGMGLGLSIVKSLVEANDGKLTIESDAGKGTMVAVTFPI